MNDCPVCKTRHSEPSCQPTITIPVKAYKRLIEVSVGDFPAGEDLELPIPDAICDSCGFTSDEYLTGDPCPNCDFDK